MCRYTAPEHVPTIADSTKWYNLVPFCFTHMSSVLAVSLVKLQLEWSCPTPSALFSKVHHLTCLLSKHHVANQQSSSISKAMTVFCDMHTKTCLKCPQAAVL